MSPMKINKTKILWSMGSAFLICWVYIGITRPTSALFYHDRLFIKYAFFIIAFNIVILLFIYPILVDKKIISADYHKENKLGKAKNNFIVISILLPGLICFWSGVFFASNVNTPLKWLMFLACFFVYLKSIYYLFLRKKKD